MEQVDKVPIPAALLDAWMTDNADFIESDVAHRNSALAAMRAARGDHVSNIRTASSYEAVPLSAVDAANVSVRIGDLDSLLVQAIHVDDGGRPIFAKPVRYSGVSGHEMTQLAAPVRVAEECALLADVDAVTIADTSFWSLLMEVNQAITLHCNHPNPWLMAAVERLVENGLFLRVLTNPNVIAMSKQGEASTLHPGLSDREAWGIILDPGEYTEPRLIVQALVGRFGIERRGFTERESDKIRDIYNKQLGVVYYKPHPWSRAYRIEAQMDILHNPERLMPILAAVHHHTQARPIVEPWPQFLADFFAKQISGVASLYGSRNRHRTPHSAARTGEVYGSWR